MEVSVQFNAPAALSSGDRVPGTHWIGGWVGPRVSLDAVEKIKILHCRESNNDTCANKFTTLIPGKCRDFAPLRSLETRSRTHPVSIQLVPGALFLELKLPGREADHSPPASAEVKNGGDILPLPDTSSWHSAYFIKLRDNFTFTFYIVIIFF
jgi:hypothetical protein